MSGRIVGLAMLLAALAAGVAVYYLQVHAFYAELAPESVEIRVAAADGSEPRPLAVSELRAIDADSSPLRFRACFLLDAVQEALEAAAPASDPTPLNAPGWFDCFDAAAIGAALESGEAAAYLGHPEIRPGVDRVIAAFPDGRGFAWHQLNGSLGN